MLPPSLRPAPMPAALLAGLLTGLLALAAACTPDDESSATDAQVFSDDVCDTIRAAVAKSPLGTLDLADHQVSDAGTPTARCTFTGAGAARLLVTATAYAVPDGSDPATVTSGGVDRACDALETGGATVKRTSTGCETAIESTVRDARRLGSGSSVFDLPQDVGVVQVDLRLDVGPADSPASRAGQTATQLSALGFGLVGLDLAR